MLQRVERKTLSLQIFRLRLRRTSAPGSAQNDNSNFQGLSLLKRLSLATSLTMMKAKKTTSMTKAT